MKMFEPSSSLKSLFTQFDAYVISLPYVADAEGFGDMIYWRNGVAYASIEYDAYDNNFSQYVCVMVDLNQNYTFLEWNRLVPIPTNVIAFLRYHFST